MTKTEIDEALEALEDALEDARWERDLARDYLEARAYLAMCEADVAVIKKRALRSLN